MLLRAFARRTVRHADEQRTRETFRGLPSPIVQRSGLPRTSGGAGKKTVRSAGQENVDSRRVHRIRARFRRMRPQSLLLRESRKISGPEPAESGFPKVTSTFCATDVWHLAGI